VRQIILENLGWRLIRLWSTDYFQDPAESVDRIDKRLKEILEEDMAQSEKQADSSGVESELSVQESLIPQNEMKSSGKSKNLYDSSAVIENNSADTSDMDDLDAARYFDSDYKVSLSDLAKSILEERNGITLHSLALEIANRHGLSRTSKKQLEHLYSVIKPWVGIKPFKGNSPVVWRSKADIVEEISWRGISPFGYERDWKEIPYPEAIGLAKLAVDKSPLNPVNFICNEFGLKRRHEKTLEEFQSWVDASKMN
jgi:hypothetical protein